MRMRAASGRRRIRSRRRPASGRFNELQERGEYIVRDILEKIPRTTRSAAPFEQKIGDYYSRCMDESAIEKPGTKPLDGRYRKMAGMKSKSDLAKRGHALHREGTDVLFDFGSGSGLQERQPDHRGTQIRVAWDCLTATIISRTTRSRSKLRKKYVAHVQKMFELSGDARTRRRRSKSRDGHRDRARQRRARPDQPARSDRRFITRSRIRNWRRSTPLSMERVFRRRGSAQVRLAERAEPDFFKQMETVVTSHSLDDWKTYLRWHVRARATRRYCRQRS